MKPQVLRVFEGLALLAVVGGAVFWLSGGFESRIAPAEVRHAVPPPAADSAQAVVARVTERAVECTSGILESANRTTVSSRILARIEEVRVGAGDLVSAGDVVIRLESRDLAARVQQAREALRAARAELELARAEESRAKQLLDRGVGTRQRHDLALSNLRVAEAEVDRMARLLEESETALSYAEITTPVGGRVVDRLAEPGDTAAPGTALLRIYDPRRLRVEAPVRESLAVHLQVGDRLWVQIAALGEHFEGVIDEIVPYAEPGARTLLVKASLPPDERLVGGMFARIGVPAGERARLYIPGAAVETIGQLQFVTVVDSSGRAERRLVTTGESDRAGRIEVLSGLAEGERVTWRPIASSEPDIATTESMQGSGFCEPPNRP